MALKHAALLCTLHNAAAGVGTALPPYKHRRGFFARGGGFAIGVDTGPSEAGAAPRIEPAVPGVFLRRVVSILLML